MMSKLRLDTVANIALICASVVVVSFTAWRWQKAAQSGPPTASEDVKDLTITLPGRLMAGVKQQSVVLMEFSDFECRFCGRFAHDTLGTLEDEFVKTGKIAHVFVNYPVENIHRFAFSAAEAAECARDLGKYDAFKTRLFAHQTELSRPDLERHAESVGIDRDAFRGCLDRGKASAVREDIALATRMRVQGTPVFFLGRQLPGGAIRVLKRLTGAESLAVFRRAIAEIG